MGEYAARLMDDRRQKNQLQLAGENCKQAWKRVKANKGTAGTFTIR
jgi:hypothetical protein